MKDTIHYISNISYISDEQSLKRHIKQLMNANKQPIHTFWDDKMDTWIKRAKIEKAKRYDARIAMKFILALPNDKIDDIDFYNRISAFLVEFFHVPVEYVDFAVHKDNPNNLHMHVLIYPRGLNGKKLRLKKSDLSNFHKSWDFFLEQEGYRIVRDPEDQKIGHIGWKLDKDIDLKTTYENYKANKQKIKEYTNMYEQLEQEEQRLENEIIKLTAEENMLLKQLLSHQENQNE